MKKAIIALAAMAASSAAVAGPSWTYIDGAYLRGSSAEQAGTDKVQGYELAGSFGFANIWHVAGAYGAAENDVGPNAAEIEDYYTITGGVHPAITDNTDFVAEIGYTSWALLNTPVNSVATTSQDATAYDLTVGVRSMLSDRFELNGFLTYQAGDTDAASGTKDKFQIFAPSVGGQYFFTDALSVNLAYTWGDVQSSVTGGTFIAADTARFGVRWSF